MNWYKPLKTAKEIGHGDTLEGQFHKLELVRLKKEVDRLRLLAAMGGPEDVLPRWRGEVRRNILLLPAQSVLDRMSMIELERVSGALDELHATMQKYSAKRFMEIMGIKDASHTGK